MSKPRQRQKQQQNQHITLSVEPRLWVQTLQQAWYVHLPGIYQVSDRITYFERNIPENQRRPFQVLRWCTRPASPHGPDGPGPRSRERSRRTRCDRCGSGRIKVLRGGSIWVATKLLYLHNSSTYGPLLQKFHQFSWVFGGLSRYNNFQKCLNIESWFGVPSVLVDYSSFSSRIQFSMKNPIRNGTVGSIQRTSTDLDPARHVHVDQHRLRSARKESVDLGSHGPGKSGPLVHSTWAAAAGRNRPWMIHCEFNSWLLEDVNKVEIGKDVKHFGWFTLCFATFNHCE